jgi:S-adenosylmethionine synthetase
MGGWDATRVALFRVKIRPGGSLGAYAARWVAKNIVAAGLAERCEVQVAYAIGVARPLSINMKPLAPVLFQMNKSRAWSMKILICGQGDIIRDLKLRRPIYRQTAAYGHFGRDDLDLNLGTYQQSRYAA